MVIKGQAHESPKDASLIYDNRTKESYLYQATYPMAVYQSNLYPFISVDRLEKH